MWSSEWLAAVARLSCTQTWKPSNKVNCKVLKFTKNEHLWQHPYGCFKSMTMPSYLCCNGTKPRLKHRVRVYSFDDLAPRIRSVEFRPGEGSDTCNHLGVHSRLPRSGTVGLPRSLTTSWLQENASTKDVAKSSQTQKSLVYITQDRQNSMKDKKVGSDARWVARKMLTLISRMEMLQTPCLDL